MVRPHEDKIMQRSSAFPQMKG